MTKYQELLRERVAALHDEGRYRIFADLKRQRGNYPTGDCWQVSLCDKVESRLVCGDCLPHCDQQDTTAHDEETTQGYDECRDTDI